MPFFKFSETVTRNKIPKDFWMRRIQIESESEKKLDLTHKICFWEIEWKTENWKPLLVRACLASKVIPSKKFCWQKGCVYTISFLAQPNKGSQNNLIKFTQLSYLTSSHHGGLFAGANLLGTVIIIIIILMIIRMWLLDLEGTTTAMQTMSMTTG